MFTIYLFIAIVPTNFILCADDGSCIGSIPKISQVVQKSICVEFQPIRHLQCKYHLRELYDIVYVNKILKQSWLLQIRRANPGIGASLAYRPYIFSASTYSGEHGPSNPEPVGFLHLIMWRIIDAVHLWFLGRFTYYFIGVSAILLMNDIVTA